MFEAMFNESFYLPHPDYGYVEFDDMVDGVVQEYMLIRNKKSLYLVYDLPEFARNMVLRKARRQLAAADMADYRVEWILSDRKAVEQLKKFFREENIRITVKGFVHILARYYPKER